jgi:myo-inositol 2-dehydrogenase/D-chiro-inositol 1-dehydrogenase
MQSDAIDRRDFLATTGLGIAGAAIGVRARAEASVSAQTVRCGFVGVGGRGTALLKATLAAENVEVVAICDTDEGNRDRARELVEKVKGDRPEPADDWKKLLARKDLTAVISALPCDLHYPMYRDALAAGKHLYAEKPLCLTVEHANALVKQAESVGTVFQIGFQRRFSEPLKSGIGLFQNGIIGQPFDGRGVRFGSGGPHRQPGEWFSFRQRSGDWMLEQAVHNFDVFNWALGELPITAFGTGRQDLFKDWDPDRDVSDYYTATLQYKSGLALTWTHTWSSPPHPHFSASYEQLVGPKGGIDLTKGLIAFRKGAAPDENQSRQLDAGERRDPTLDAIQSFFECVRTGQAPVVGVKEGRDATLFGLLVRKAVYEKRLVTMDEILKGA